MPAPHISFRALSPGLGLEIRVKPLPTPPTKPQIPKQVSLTRTWAPRPRYFSKPHIRYSLPRLRNFAAYIRDLIRIPSPIAIVKKSPAKLSILAIGRKGVAFSIDLSLIAASVFFYIAWLSPMFTIPGYNFSHLLALEGQIILTLLGSRLIMISLLGILLLYVLTFRLLAHRTFGEILVKPRLG